MLQRSTVQLLRFHFSLFLLPVYLFAVSEVPVLRIFPTLLLFAILHLLVYPASNGYNSYMDRDDTPIGGLRDPMQPTRQLFHASILLDAIAVLSSAYFGAEVAVGILLYILASRAYSYRGIRLKRHPYIGFLTVFVFQGGWIFFITSIALNRGHLPSIIVLVIASCLIGALYPLTQIYQHKADITDGVVTISYRLGKRGSFIFTGILFAIATGLMFLHFQQSKELRYFMLFEAMLFPVVLFFLYWMMLVWKRPEAANFRNSFRMNLISTLCTTIFFITLIILKH